MAGSRVTLGPGAALAGYCQTILTIGFTKGGLWLVGEVNLLTSNNLKVIESGIGKAWKTDSRSFAAGTWWPSCLFSKPILKYKVLPLEYLFKEICTNLYKGESVIFHCWHLQSDNHDALSSSQFLVVRFLGVHLDVRINVQS